MFVLRLASWREVEELYVNTLRFYEALQNQDQIRRLRWPSRWVEDRWWSLTCTGALCFPDPICSGHGMASTMAFSLYILLVLALHVVDCVLGGVLVDARMRMTAQVGGRENGSRGSGDPFVCGVRRSRVWSRARCAPEICRCGGRNGDVGAWVPQRAGLHHSTETRLGSNRLYSLNKGILWSGEYKVSAGEYSAFIAYLFCPVQPMDKSERGEYSRATMNSKDKG